MPVRQPKIWEQATDIANKHFNILEKKEKENNIIVGDLFSPKGGAFVVSDVFFIKSEFF